MGREGDCRNNAVAESFFDVLKTELIHHERFATRREARGKLFDCIEVFHNRGRIHSANDYFGPPEF